MSKVSAFGFTNVSPSQHSEPFVALGLTTNYALTEDAADTVILSNKTTPIDAEELVTFKTRRVSNITTRLNLQHPSPVKGGVWYAVEEEAVLSTTDSADASFRVDDPIVCRITVTHPRSGNITPAHVDTIINRARSALMKATGESRVADLIRGAERPIED